MRAPMLLGARCARRFLGASLAAVLLAASTAGAVELPTAVQHTESPAFRARTVPITENDSTAIAIQIEIPYAALCFPRSGDGWQAHFQMIATAWRRDRQVAGDLWRDSIRVAERRELRGRKARYVRECVLPLPPGEYEVEVTLSEPQCGEEGRIRLGAFIPSDLKGQAQFSTILLGSCGLTGTLRQLLGDPRVRLDFADSSEAVCVYADLTHRGLQGDSIRVQWKLTRPGDEKPLREGRVAFAPDSVTTRLTWPVPLKGLGMDSYRLDAIAAFGGVQAEQSLLFDVRIETERTLAPFFHRDLDVLRYVATDDEVDALRKAAPAERAAAWAAFWRKRDPTPATDENEFKDEFFRRMAYANREFAGRMSPGWRTDRGRIYIEHGEPDSIERDPMPRGGYPLEIWTYDQPGLRFVFLDRTGFGDFRLVEGPE